MTSTSLAAIPTASSLREQVTTALRGAIITGQMPAGQLYSVPVLARTFNVSATPVREAMVDLSRDGLVIPVRNKGFRIAEPTEQELDDLTAVRELLEVPSVADIARGNSGQWERELTSLAAIADDIVQYARAGDLVSYVEADRRFHLGLLALTGNGELVATVARLRDRGRLYGLEHLVTAGTLQQSAAEHQELIDLVQACDPDGAADLMRRHIRHVRGQWAGREE